MPTSCWIRGWIQALHSVHSTPHNHDRWMPEMMILHSYAMCHVLILGDVLVHGTKRHLINVQSIDKVPIHSSGWSTDAMLCFLAAVQWCLYTPTAPWKYTSRLISNLVHWVEFSIYNGITWHDIATWSRKVILVSSFLKSILMQKHQLWLYLLRYISIFHYSRCTFITNRAEFFQNNINVNTKICCNSLYDMFTILKAHWPLRNQ